MSVFEAKRQAIFDMLDISHTEISIKTFPDVNYRIMRLRDNVYCAKYTKGDGKIYNSVRTIFDLYLPDQFDRQEWADKIIDFLEGDML